MNRNFDKGGGNVKVGLRIREYLHETGRTQSWLSKQIGISTSKLSLALLGKRRMTFDEYELICGALGVDTNKFIKPRVLDKIPTANPTNQSA